MCAKSPGRSSCHDCIVSGYHRALQFIYLCRCISWDTAYKISLFLDKNFLSGSKYKGPHPIAKVTRLNSIQLLLYMDAIPCICSQIKSFYLMITKFVVHDPNTHTNATKKTAGRCDTQGQCNYEITVNRPGLFLRILFDRKGGITGGSHFQSDSLVN